MATQQQQTFEGWIAAAKAMQKQASITSVKDPNDRGTVSVTPDPNATLSKLNLPARGDNLKAPDLDHTILDVTKPSGVMEGERQTFKDGTAEDCAFELSNIQNVLNTLSGKTKTQKKSANAAETTDTFSMPADMTESPELMRKLASIGAYVAGTEAGRQFVASSLEQTAGIQECKALIDEAAGLISKQANVNSQYNTNMTNYNEIAADAMCKQAHVSWIESFNTDLEKQAYAQGAADGENMAQALEAGASAEEAADAAGMSEEDVVEMLQELVENGTITEEEAAGVIQLAQAVAEGGVTEEELASILQQAAAQEQITPDHATAIAEAALNSPEGQAAIADAQEKTASVVNYLYGQA